MKQYADNQQFQHPIMPIYQHKDLGNLPVVTDIAEL
jgi:hypothetical protein